MEMIIVKIQRQQSAKRKPVIVYEMGVTWWDLSVLANCIKEGRTTGNGGHIDYIFRVTLYYLQV